MRWGRRQENLEAIVKHACTESCESCSSSRFPVNFFIAVIEFVCSGSGRCSLCSFMVIEKLFCFTCDKNNAEAVLIFFLNSRYTTEKRYKY